MMNDNVEFHQGFESPPPNVGMPQAGGLRYMEAYTDIFENPNWLMNLLFGSICQFIPIVGPIILLGYTFRIIDDQLNQRAETYTNFDFNDFGEYLMRGLWPFLIALVASAVIGPVVGMILVPLFLCSGILGGEILTMLASVILSIVATTVLIAVISLVAVPMILRAGLMQDFAAGFDMTFVKDFFSKTWKETLLHAVFLWASLLVLLPLGAIVFCVGSYIAATMYALAQAHLMCQLYRLYLQRGGMPIEIAPPKPKPF